MPVSYQFIDRLTGQNVDLERIDNEICAKFGRAASSNQYSFEFDSITMIGIGCYQNGYFDINAFNDITKDSDTDTRDKMLYFLDGRYQFQCWR